MKALENIQNEAKVIVEQLAERQINSMKERYNQFQEWMKKSKKNFYKCRIKLTNQSVRLIL
jgi:CHASE1-domain containing sensor protein